MLQLKFIPLHLFFLLTNLSNHFCNMLHRTTARHTICHCITAQREYLFAQTVLFRIHLILLRFVHEAPCSHPAGSCWRCFVVLWDASCRSVCTALTSLRGPGSLIRPVLLWCTACHRIPGCCVCTEPQSCGTPDSSCPTGTCSTTHQPPSHPTRCHLKCMT